MTSTVRIRLAEPRDATAIAEIYNQAMADRVSTFETRPRTVEEMDAKVTEAGRYPLLIVENWPGVIAGWGALSAYRPRDCYDGIGEFSIYLDPRARGQGLGRQLLNALVDEAERRGFWKLLSRVFTFNTASRALCQACGFREVGIYEKHAQLDGRWLDVVIVERLIPANQPA